MYDKIAAALSLVVLGLTWSLLDRDTQTKSAADGKPAADFRWTECPFDVPPSRNIHCGIYRTGSGAGRFELPVAVIRDTSEDHRDDALLYLAGGPGDVSQMSEPQIESWLYWLDSAGLSRDLILFDQRGTGRSRPNLDCEAYDNFSLRVLHRNVDMETEYREGLAVLRQCLSSLKSRGFDPAHFSTQLGAADVRGLMRQLDYSSWNLLGVSYGTRLALQVADVPITGLRSAILDSPYPRDKGGLTEWPWLLDHALSRLWRACAETPRNPVCEDPKTPLQAIFWTLMAQLKQAPATLTVRHWQGEPPIDIVVNDHRLLSVIYSSLYDVGLYGKIAGAIIGAEQGDTRALRELVEAFANYALDTGFSHMVYFATECADNRRVSEAEYEAARAAYPRLMPYTGFDWKYDFCKDLGSGNGGELVVEGHEAMPPTLILAGQMDPVTPPSWARGLQAQIASSQVLVFPGVGHAVISSSDCAHGLLRSFLDRPQRRIAPDCVQGG
ncbi:MAG: alpha/beta fold hydrolase [Exilibacterium sp.]